MHPADLQRFDHRLEADASLVALLWFEVRHEFEDSCRNDCLIRKVFDEAIELNGI